MPHRRSPLARLTLRLRPVARTVDVFHVKDIGTDAKISGKLLFVQHHFRAARWSWDSCPGHCANPPSPPGLPLAHRAPPHRVASLGGRAASQCEQLPPPRPAESRVAMLRESLEHLCAGVQPDVTHDETWELTQHLASPSPFVNAASPSAPAAALTSTPPPLTVLPARAARAIRRRCART